MKIWINPNMKLNKHLPKGLWIWNKNVIFRSELRYYNDIDYVHVYRLLGPGSSSTFKLLKYSDISSVWRIISCWRISANSQSLRHMRTSTISGVSDILRLSRILPDRLKADSEEIVETGILSTSRANFERIGKSFSCCFYHYKTSISLNGITIPVRKYLSSSSLCDPGGV